MLSNSMSFLRICIHDGVPDAMANNQNDPIPYNIRITEFLQEFVNIPADLLVWVLGSEQNALRVF